MSTIKHTLYLGVILLQALVIDATPSISKDAVADKVPAKVSLTDPLMAQESAQYGTRNVPYNPHQASQPPPAQQSQYNSAPAPAQSYNNNGGSSYGGDNGQNSYNQDQSNSYGNNNDQSNYGQNGGSQGSSYNSAPSPPPSPSYGPPANSGNNYAAPVPQAPQAVNNYQAPAVNSYNQPPPQTNSYNQPPVQNYGSSNDGGYDASGLGNSGYDNNNNGYQGNGDSTESSYDGELGGDNDNLYPGNGDTGEGPYSGANDDTGMDGGYGGDDSDSGLGGGYGDAPQAAGGYGNQGSSHSGPSSSYGQDGSNTGYGGNSAPTPQLGNNGYQSRPSSGNNYPGSAPNSGHSNNYPIPNQQQTNNNYPSGPNSYSPPPPPPASHAPAPQYNNAPPPAYPPAPSKTNPPAPVHHQPPPPPPTKGYQAPPAAPSHNYPPPPSQSYPTKHAPPQGPPPQQQQQQHYDAPAPNHAVKSPPPHQQQSSSYSAPESPYANNGNSIPMSYGGFTPLGRRPLDTQPLVLEIVSKRPSAPAQDNYQVTVSKGHQQPQQPPRYNPGPTPIRPHAPVHRPAPQAPSKIYNSPAPAPKQPTYGEAPKQPTYGEAPMSQYTNGAVDVYEGQPLTGAAGADYDTSKYELAENPFTSSAEIYGESEESEYSSSYKPRRKPVMPSYPSGAQMSYESLAALSSTQPQTPGYPRPVEIQYKPKPKGQGYLKAGYNLDYSGGIPYTGDFTRKPYGTKFRKNPLYSLGEGLDLSLPMKLHRPPIEAMTPKLRYPKLPSLSMPPLLTDYGLASPWATPSLGLPKGFGIPKGSMRIPSSMSQYEHVMSASSLMPQKFSPMSIEEAKNLLKSAGYNVDALKEATSTTTSPDDKSTTIDDTDDYKASGSKLIPVKVKAQLSSLVKAFSKNRSFFG